jgi:hypothetical protein
MTRLCRWIGKDGYDHVSNTYYNQALNTLYNYGSRGLLNAFNHLLGEFTVSPVANGEHRISCAPAAQAETNTDLLITDPPYGDAVNYHEITEFFIAWLRKRPPAPLKDWVWDSRRALAVQGSGHGFRVAMVEAFSNFARQMPDHGIQVVMFTHSSADVWASLVRALWGAGLQVKAAWYVLTETNAGVRDANLVQGTTLLVLRKRLGAAEGFTGRLDRAVRKAVEARITSLQALEDPAAPSFSDLDLIQAGYAAACEVLTGFGALDGVDVRTDVLQPDPPPPPRARKAAPAPAPAGPPSRQSLVEGLLHRAGQHASELLVPARLRPERRNAHRGDLDATEIWKALDPVERFVVKALDAEADGARKLGTIMELAKLFNVQDWRALLGSTGANDARLCTAAQLGARSLSTTAQPPAAATPEARFAAGPLRHALYGVHLARETDDLQKALRFFAQSTPDYWARRPLIQALLEFTGLVRSPERAAEAEFAAALAGAVRNHRPT